MSLLDELKRRKVFKVAAAYAVVAWLLVQIIVEIEEPLSLPGWVDTLVIVLLMLGFPMAIVLAWAFDITADGIVVTPSADKGESAADVDSVNAVDSRSTELADTHEKSPGNRIAILPFENLGSNPENAHLSSGIHGEIINHLSNIKALSIIARTSVMQYSGTEHSIEEIASALNVDAIMEGTIQHANGRIRLNTQLVDAQKNVNLWTDSYDREIKDIFEIQTDIATRIADALTIELSLAEQESIEARPTNSMQAYDHYLRAMSTYREGDSASGATAPSGTREAMQSSLDNAIAIDPGFAMAYAWKAWIYTYSRAYDAIEENEWISKSSALDKLVVTNANKSLLLDPRVGLAHAALAKVHLYNWRVDAAEAEFEQALQLSPGDPEVLRWCANFNWFVEKHNEAIRLAKRAVALDPVNTSYYDLLGRVYHSAGEYDEATRAFQKSIDINPGVSMDYISLARSEFASGDCASALDALTTAERLMTESATPGLRADLANGYRQVGQHESAAKLASQIREAASDRYIDPPVQAFASLAAGDHQRALQHLRDVLARPALIANPFIVMFIKRNAWSDPALEQPEFYEVRDRLGFVA